jgi:hypothetical protein
MAQSPGHRLFGSSRGSGYRVQRSAFLALVLCVVCLAGCRQAMRDLQHGNLRSGLFPMTMTLTVGDGKNDTLALMKASTYEGVVTRGNVNVHYPAGMADQAARIADAFEAARDEIRARTGITWAFKPDVYLVTTPDVRGGFGLRMHLRGSRVLKLPMLVNPRGPTFCDPDWSQGLAHEITESSMLNALARRETILGDYGWEGNEIANRTRWFRDGVSDFAGDILNERLFGEGYQPSAWIYQALEKVGPDLLDWANFEDTPPPTDEYEYYAASLALVRELTYRAGPDAIARITQAAFEEKAVDGYVLDRAVKKVVGLDLEEFLRGYRMTWLGADFDDTSHVPGVQSLVEPGNQVRVLSVHPGTPADKWKLRPGDVIFSVDGVQPISAAWLVHHLAARRPGDRIQVEVLRLGQRTTHRMKLSACYPGE